METKSRFLIERAAFSEMQVESVEKYLHNFKEKHGKPNFFVFQSVNHFNYAVLTVDIDELEGQIQFLIDPKGQIIRTTFKGIDEILFETISPNNHNLTKYLNNIK